MAIDLLFAKALGECDKQAVREFATQRLGANVLMSVSPSARRSNRTNDSSGNMVKSSSQSSILSFLKPVDPATSYMVTKAIVESGRKQKEEKKEKEKEEKKEAPAKKKRASKTVKVDV